MNLLNFFFEPRALPHSHSKNGNQDSLLQEENARKEEANTSQTKNNHPQPNLTQARKEGN
jgi:hypothetical protein